MTAELSLSTMYAQRWADRTDLGPFFELGAAMGFASFELSHILPASAVAAVDPSVVRIGSVHHPCPADDVPRGAEAGSERAEARQAAARALLRSVETAARLGAAGVVVHLGRTPDRDGRLARLEFEIDARAAAGAADSPRAAAARAELADLLAPIEDAVLDRAVETLAPVVDRAADAGVRLGIETGFGVLHLPTPGGMARLLDALSGRGLRAWLDTGHVAASARRGRAGFDEWLAAVDGRWLGVHAHDAVGLRDHLMPGMGTIGFSELARRLPRDLLWTLEIDWYFTPEEVVRGADHLRAALADAGL